MNVGLVTPPGLLGDFVARALGPAGHQLTIAPNLLALVEQSASPPDVVLFSPVLAVEAALRSATDIGLGREQLIYLGLDWQSCETARKSGFIRALHLPFQARELLNTIQDTARGRARILLVDDSELVHRHTLAILETAGYEVDEAWDGEAGWAQLCQRRPDVLLTDVEMPKLNGFELCRRVKQNPTTLDIPVVICSSLGQAENLEQGFDAGADDYLVKPVVAEELTTRLHALLATRLAAEREHILIVDDSAAIRHLVADCLRRQGFFIETAVDGQDGYEKAATKAPDLVLTDYDMPRMTGFELVMALRKNTKTRDVPLVMLTARDSSRDQAQMRAAGITSYLVKPFGNDKCIAIVERVLAENRLARYKEASRLYISEGGVRAAEELAKSADFAEVRARQVDATLLFSDISGFTSMSSRMSPADVVQVLNASFDALCVVIKKYGGDIDKFIGDAIMAVFEDAPEFDEPHTLRATRAAWGMQQALTEFNLGREPPLLMRIGLNCGLIVRGDIGSSHVRRDYTCIGDAVNRAQRHEANCPLGRVLLSEALYASIREHVQVEEIGGIQLKGINNPVSAFVLQGFVEKV